MMARFTERASKVMALANQEAQRFNHEYVGTEHILLGLVREGSGVGAGVLRSLGLDLARARVEVEKLIKVGPDIVAMGNLPYTPRAKNVLEAAMTEADALGHNYVGTEHLLLGLLREGESVAAQVLTTLGLKLDEVREEVLNLLGAGTGGRLADGDAMIAKGEDGFLAGVTLGRRLSISFHACLRKLGEQSGGDSADRAVKQRIEELENLLAAWPDLPQATRDAIMKLTRESKS